MQQRGEKYGLKPGIAVLLKYSHGGVSLAVCTDSVTCSRTERVQLLNHKIQSSDSPTLGDHIKHYINQTCVLSGLDSKHTRSDFLKSSENTSLQFGLHKSVSYLQYTI